jgi:hypothetical protein
MNFLIGLIGTILGKLFGRRASSSGSEKTHKVENLTPNEALMDARAAIIWVCAIVLGMYWISLYGIAIFFFIKTSIAEGKMVQFPLDTGDLFKMIGSLLGLGTLESLRKLIK